MNEIPGILATFGYIRIHASKDALFPIVIANMIFQYFDGDLPTLRIGDMIQVNNIDGQVKYIGSISINEEHFTNEEIVGIELWDWSPNARDGFIKHIKLFQTSMGRAYIMKKQTVESTVVPSKVERGAWAQLKDLHNMSHLNGECVEVLEFLEKRGRWKTILYESEFIDCIKKSRYLCVRPENLEPFMDWNTIHSHSNESVTNAMDVYVTIADRIRTLTIPQMYGIVKYIGMPSFEFVHKNEILIGIELDEWNPNGNDGTVMGVQYFDVKQGMGYFAAPNDVALVTTNVNYKVKMSANDAYQLVVIGYIRKYGFKNVPFPYCAIQLTVKYI